MSVDNQMDGPSFIQPPIPAPYYTCSGCQHFHKEMAHSGGLSKGPSYFLYCTHPNAVIEGTGRRDLGHGFRGTRDNRHVTPDWCPVHPTAQEQFDERCENMREASDLLEAKTKEK